MLADVERNGSKEFKALFLWYYLHTRICGTIGRQTGPLPVVIYIGVYLEKYLSIKRTWSISVSLALRRISAIPLFDFKEWYASLVYMSATPWFCYCNSFISGITSDKFSCFQHMQNIVARLILKMHKRGYIQVFLNNFIRFLFFQLSFDLL